MKIREEILDKGKESKEEGKNNLREWVTEEIEQNKNLLGLIYEDVYECKQRCNEKLENMKGNVENKCDLVMDMVKRDVKSRLENIQDMIELTRGRDKFDEKVVRRENINKEEDIATGIKKVRDMTMYQDLIAPKFGNGLGENPKQFINELEEFFDLKGIPEEGKRVWFKKCVDDRVILWYEAIGKNTRTFEELKSKFLESFWSKEIQLEVVRKYYNPMSAQNFKGSKENYVLTISRENKYLDEPIPEKNLVGILSRHFDTNIAKQISISGIETIEEFANILNKWENIEKEDMSWQENMGRNDNRNSRGYMIIDGNGQQEERNEVMVIWMEGIIIEKEEVEMVKKDGK